MVDIDGSYTYSAIKLVKISRFITTGISNPARQFVTVENCGVMAPGLISIDGNSMPYQR